MQIEIELICENQSKTVSCEMGDCLLNVIKAANVLFDAPCGGNHTCGKCKVVIQSGTFSPLSAEEHKFLSNQEIESGVRLACLTHVIDGGRVKIPQKTNANIRELGVLREVECLPAIVRKYLELNAPSATDQRDDQLRIQESLKTPVKFSFDALRKLPQVLAEANYKLTVVKDQNTIIKVLPFNQTLSQFGVAIDIGTTTVVAYLIDGISGEVVATVSSMNEQKLYGADVISRIQYTIEHEDGLQILCDTIVKQVDRMIGILANRAKISTTAIDSAVFTGNTIMTHFLLGVSPKSIAMAPFQPVFTQIQKIPAQSLGLKLFEGEAVILPCVSGYIGSDITSGMVACDLQKDEKLKLLVDIGTNGEMVLGNSEFLLGCSTAAGPAFEGAEIRFGMGGTFGAISTFSMENGKISFATIGGESPVGICGSGLIDIMAALIENNIVDDTGRMLKKEELSEPFQNYASIVDGEPAFIIAEGEMPIVMTQKDVRQLQLAKAAVAAGICSLVDSAGKTLKDVDTIYLAGGFGSFIDKHSATQIGLLPKETEDRICVVGNAAGMGAILAVKSEAILNKMIETAKNTQYIELSTSPKFQDFYMDSMFF